MSESLKNFGRLSYNFDDEKYLAKDSEGKPFELSQHVLEWEGNTVWERCHPTFISQKRKVILTCPRKVGHSSIRFYLNYMNQMEDDDWIWIEGEDRYPKNWLDKDTLGILYNDLFSDIHKINTVSSKDTVEAVDIYSSTHPYHYSSQLVWNRDEEQLNKLFGEDNSITYPQKFTNNNEKMFERETSFSPPFQILNPFKDYTSYLVVRDPWERFISGLITEMDNGLLNPWKYDTISDTERGWELLYNSCKRVLYFTEPEYLTLGGLDGPQANHTFILSRPLWRGKSMYDIYDKFVHYKHDIDYIKNNSNQMGVDQKSLENTTGVIGNLVNLGFISENAVEQFHIKQKNEMYSHTHMNVTPHIRQHVISELQEDEDLKDWWNRCRELVDYDYECLKNNQHKFENT
tara:strand:+ start:1032 stop:2240 length:1209 start_codon:yes stop_codon:yes gene_type:complete